MLQHFVAIALSLPARILTPIIITAKKSINKGLFNVASQPESFGTGEENKVIVNAIPLKIPITLIIKLSYTS